MHATHDATQAHDHRHGPASHGHAGHRHHHDAGEVRAQPVVLELGQGVGALVVRTDPALGGIEVEISPAGSDGERQHKQVLERALGPETAHVLVYDNLAAGDYTLWIDGAAVERGVRVRDGEVAELDWRAADPGPTEPLARPGRTSGVQPVSPINERSPLT
jgi:hypothetical protein